MERTGNSRTVGLGLFMLFAAVALSAAVPIRADDESGWRLRVDFAVVDPSSDTRQFSGGGGVVLEELDAGAGFGVRGEYQFSKRIGIDFGFLNTASVDVTASTTGFASVDVESFSPLSVGVDFHLTPDKRVDLYIGPQVALVQYDSVFISASPGHAGTTVSIDTDIGLGAMLGLDVPLGEARHWAFQTNLRFLSTSMEGNSATGRLDADFDPTIFALGFGYRW